MKSIKTECEGRTLEELQAFAGLQDGNLAVFEKEFKTPVVLRGHSLQFLDVPDDLAEPLKAAVQAAFDMLDERGELSPQDISYVSSMAKKGKLEGFEPVNMGPVVKTRTGKVIYPRTRGQGILFRALQDNEIVFAVGAAGTGKTYLGVAHAVELYKKGKVEKIILTRPAVEAGESLGFLPGDMKDKVDPYLRPLYDALYEMLGQDTAEKLMERDVIEIAPLAFMRGRTLNDAVVILDEAQNTTRAQMKMFLTRLGNRARMIVTGDITQIDLIKKGDSGLVEACRILDGIDGIAVVRLQESDVVRHPLVQKIIAAYSDVE